MNGKDFLRNSIFFIGWILSPFTAWNDAIVNIPLSYLCANLFLKIMPANFLLSVLVFYWLSNVLGIALMYVSGKGIVKGGGGVLKALGNLILTSLLYSIILIIIYRIGILKPL